MKESAFWNHWAVEQEAQWLCSLELFFFRLLPNSKPAAVCTEQWLRRALATGKKPTCSELGVLPRSCELLHSPDNEDYIFSNIVLMKSVLKTFENICFSNTDHSGAAKMNWIMIGWKSYGFPIQFSLYWIYKMKTNGLLCRLLWIT